jgi:hypothetical protein
MISYSKLYSAMRSAAVQLCTFKTLAPEITALTVITPPPPPTITLQSPQGVALESLLLVFRLPRHCNLPHPADQVLRRSSLGVEVQNIIHSNHSGLSAGLTLAFLMPIGRSSAHLKWTWFHRTHNESI